MQGPIAYKSSYSTRQLIINLSLYICFDYTNSKMLLQFKLLLFALVFHLVHSNNEDFDIDSTTSNESCTEPNEATSESNCYCYSQPEMDFEHSICVPKKCPLDDPSYFLEQGKCLYLEKKLMNFKDAREKCKEKGGKLHEPKDIVNDATYYVLPIEMISKFYSTLGNTWVWIGITDPAKHSIGEIPKYVYDSTGQSINFKYWPQFMFPCGARGHGVPTKGNCITLSLHLGWGGSCGGKLADFPCSFYANSLCEF